jgi:phosphate butyryltransferase
MMDIRDEAAVPRRGHRLERLVEVARRHAPLPTAVVSPESHDALAGALEARDLGLIDPILIGDRSKITALAQGMGADISALRVDEAEDTIAAADHGVALVREGTAKALMKGHLHTEDFLRPIVRREGGLRTRRRISHIFIMDSDDLDHLILVSDAAIAIAPDLMQKTDITQNAIDLARAIGIALPKVAILSAIETVSPAMASSIDAAILSKMAERGQITGGIIDGPLAMDNALNPEAAKAKGLNSKVAGHADVLIVPNIEAGNMLAKDLIFVSGAASAGLVVGASVPIILTSRSDGAAARVASCAAALAYDFWRQTGQPIMDWDALAEPDEMQGL